VVVDLDVVIDVDLAPLPDPVLIGALRQRPQRRLVELLEEAAPTPSSFLKGRSLSRWRRSRIASLSATPEKKV